MRRTLIFFVLSIFAASVLTGCGDSENFVFTNTSNGGSGGPNNPVQDQPPTAVDDTFAALGNATLNRGGSGVLANDTLEGGEIVAFDSQTTNGGTVVLNDDGTFSYTPVTDFQGADTFTYTLENSEGTSTATVTLNVNGFAIFVENDAAANGTGTQASPFNTLTEALAVAESGDTIYVRNGDGTTNGLSGAFTLDEGVNLVGEGTGLIVAQEIEPSGTAPTLTGPITTSGSNIIEGFSFDQQQTDEPFIRCLSVDDVTIRENTFDATSEESVRIENSCSGLAILNNTFTQTANEEYIDYSGGLSGTVALEINLSGNTFTYTGNGDTRSCFNIFMTGTDSTANVTADDNSFTGTGTDAGMDNPINFSLSGPVSLTAVITNNEMRDLMNHGIQCSAGSTGPDVNLTVNGNICDNMEVEFLNLNLGDEGTGTVSMDNNMATNGNNRALFFQAGEDAELDVTVTNSTFSNLSVLDRAISVAGSGNMTAIFTGCTISNVGNGIGSNPSSGANLNLAIRNCTFTDIGDDCLEYFSTLDGNLCADITGNTFTNRILLNNTGTGTANVEQFGVQHGGPLTAVNNFTDQNQTVLTNGTITSQPDGFCQIP